VQHDADITRRGAIVGTAVSVVGIGALAACGGGDSDADSGSSGGSATSATGGSGVLAKLSDIPVGGAVSATNAAGEPLIIAQPKAGTVTAFSAICPHQRCTVAPKDDHLECPCHFSRFALATGALIPNSGPATSDLTPVTVQVDGENVVPA